MITHSSTIHLWVPEIRDGGGGIQALSREYITAIRSAFPSHGIRVLVKNDALDLDDCLRGANISFHSTAGCPRLLRTLAFALLGLWLGLRDKPVLTLAMHLHFLPATGLLKPLLAPFNVCVLHGIEVWQKLSFLRLTALRAADKLIAVSQHTGHLAIGMHSLNANRVTTVPNSFNTGRGGVAVSQGGMMGAANPEQQALLNAQALQDLELATRAQEQGRAATTFGAGLFGTGLDLASGGYNPLKTQFGLAQSLEAAGQSPLDIGAQLGGRSAAAGANVGQTLFQGGTNAARAMEAANAYSPVGAAISGLAGNKQFTQGLADWFRTPPTVGYGQAGTAAGNAMVWDGSGYTPVI